MFDNVLNLPRPDEISGSASEKLRAVERQLAALIEEHARLRRLLGGDPFKMEERLSRLAKLAARAQALATEHEMLSGSENTP
jgi:hypothetical protein